MRFGQAVQKAVKESRLNGGISLRKMNYEEILNEKQLEGVYTTEGAVLVIAGAGSGKTRVLTYRIAYLIEELEVSPYNILAITFTNKATNEMKERLEKLTRLSKGVWVSTFHSFCARVLRVHIEKLGYQKEFSIYDDVDCSRLIKRILQNKHQKDDARMVNAIECFISDAKNKGIAPSESLLKCGRGNYDQDKLYSEIYEAYDEELKKNNALDYDDLLLKTVILFTQFPDVLKYYAERFKYIHIDEYQDTNKIQYLLVRMLSKVHGNLFAVGDDDQSIYGWRGAEISNIINFRKDFPQAKVIKLEQNYRSTGNILNVSNILISYNNQRYGKKLWTSEAGGENVYVKRKVSDSEEAEFVVGEIARRIKEEGASPKDFAVLVRLNALTNKIEERLNLYAIPYKVYGGMKFFDRKEIKDVLAYVKAIVNPKDSEAMLRIINTPKRGIGDTVISALRDYCNREQVSVSDALFGNNVASFGPQIDKKLNVFKTLYYDLFNKAISCKPSDAVSYIVDKAGFSALYSGADEDNYNRMLNIGELINSVKEFETVNPDCDLSEYLQGVSLSSDSDDIQSDDFVTLATVHAVKGLEFKIVFIIGLEENVFPCNVISKSAAEIEEERRVMYVAMTRAQKVLYMTYCATRYRFGKEEYNGVSRFIEEIKRGMGYKKPEPPKQPQAKAPSVNTAVVINTSKEYVAQYGQKEEKKIIKVSIAQKVMHKKFGKGTVIAVNGENATIAFDSVGIKVMNLRVAPIEVIG